MIEIKPVTYPINAIVKIPGSKSYTNRALITAALADGESTIANALFSDDTKYMVSSLNTLGIPVKEEQNMNRFIVNGKGGVIPVKHANLFVGNAGTAMRFLTAMLTLGKGVYEIDGVARMRQRPIQDLLDGLNQLGADVVSKFNNGCPPVIIRGRELEGGSAIVKGDLSSQYFSAMLMTSPYAKQDVSVEVKGNAHRAVGANKRLSRDRAVHALGPVPQTHWIGPPVAKGLTSGPRDTVVPSRDGAHHCAILLG
jgi:3-phosphoshikimate 1-carboxyvinyltransferase